MMRKCIIHYGMHKTGSSSIQKTLQRNLQDSNFYYLDINSSGNHSKPIQNAFSNKTKNIVSDHNKTDQIEAIRRGNHLRYIIENELEKAGNRVTIISGESISIMPQESLVDFRGTLSKYFDDIQLVGYIRPPASFIESAFQQVVKGGASDFNLRRLYPHYRRNFSRIESVFGQENVSYWNFDTKSFPSGCVVTDFCSRIGIEINQNSIIKVNESLSLPAIKLLYTFRKFSYEVNAKRLSTAEEHVLINALSDLDGPKIKFHSSLLRPILRDNRSSTKWMERRLGSSLEQTISNTKLSIKSEEGLLSIGKIPKRWLSDKLGTKHHKKWKHELTSIDIAEWMKLYREKLLLERR